MIDGLFSVEHCLEKCNRQATKETNKSKQRNYPPPKKKQTKNKQTNQQQQTNKKQKTNKKTPLSMCLGMRCLG